MIVTIKEDIPNQAFIAMEAEDNRFVFGEESVEFFIGQAPRIDIGMAQFQQIYHIDKPHLHIRVLLVQNTHGG